LHDFAGQADAVAEFLPVLLGGHVVEQDARVLARVLDLTWMRPRLGERMEPMCAWKPCSFTPLLPL
jgi:hypothetical protein